MRTEDDLRAALVALERHAPSADTVLRAVRDGAGQRRPGAGRRWPGWVRAARLARSPRWPHLVTGLATAAAVAGLVVALLAGGASLGAGGQRPDPAASGALPSAASLGKAMLTAFSAATGDVLYTKTTTTKKGVAVGIGQDWYWPAQPVPGQPARTREVLTLSSSPARPLKLTEDTSITYTAPPAGAEKVSGHVTVVCYAGTGQTGCGYGPTETPPGTWSQHSGRFLNPVSDTNVSPSSIARQIAKGQWRITRRTQLAGQPVIELTATKTSQYAPLPALLWVNARTYLPIRMTTRSEVGQPDWVGRSDYRYLKPTAAALAQLQVHIPAGYPRSANG